MLLNAFKMRDLQTLITLLDMAEAEHITDVRWLRTKLNEKLGKDRRQGIREGWKDRKPKAQRGLKMPAKVCPDCGTIMHMVIDIKGNPMQVFGCKKCRYSEWSDKTFEEYVAELNK